MCGRGGDSRDGNKAKLHQIIGELICLLVELTNNVVVSI